MSDPVRTDLPRELQPTSEAERDAKIEQLLLAGLDHYFAAQYEHAINVWTRALFLDRNHARARAYIERARSALAERQRESEELLHSGVAAFHRGDGDEARRLLEAAMLRGAPSDEALAVLERLNRLEHGYAAPAHDHAARADRPRGAMTAHTHLPSSRLLLAAVGGVVLVVAAAGYVMLAAHGSWGAAAEAVDAPLAAPPLADPPLPLPRRGTLALERARAFVAGGRLRDALSVLDEVRATDAEKPEADRLRGEIQKQLLSLVTLPSPAAAVPNAPQDSSRQ